MKLVTVAEMRQIEQETDARGWTYEQMMQAAGTGLAHVVAERLAQDARRSVVGLVGSGNNGGDTLVALTELLRLGWQATAYLARPRPQDPLVERFARNGGWVLTAEDDPHLHTLRRVIAEHDVLLDGLLGTGIHLPLREHAARVLAAAKEAVAQAATAVVAVDVPSGIDCDTGEAAHETLRADLTVTMAAAKVGMIHLPALSLVGEVVVVDIGVPDDLPAWQHVQRYWADAALVRGVLPPRPPDAHKGTFGTALVVAGSVNFTGAALLAGEAAYRSGAGLVTLAVPAPLHPALAGQFPEATWVLLPHEMGVIAEGAADVVRQALTPRVTALLLGPGFGQEPPTAAFLARLLAAAPKNRGGLGFVPPAAEEKAASSPLPPLVVDADGLKLLTRLENWPQHLPAPAVLTPHPGEMSVLTGLPRADIQADRLGVAERFAREWGHVVVLKGASTVVAAPDGRVAVIPVATPALARAGTGDVLAGIIVGLRAQRVPPWEAAVAGAWLHAKAGLLAWEGMGTSAAVLAGDVLAALPDVLAALGYR